MHIRMRCIIEFPIWTQSALSCRYGSSGVLAALNS